MATSLEPETVLRDQALELPIEIVGGSEGPGAAEAADPARPRILDGVLELMAYTCTFLKMDASRQPSFEDACASYATLFQRAEAVCAQGHFPEQDWSEALFAVCAWIDERILCSTWEGRRHWLQAQLQRSRFHTTQGGELFFRKLEALPMDALQVREVFDYCLALGFQGCYYGADDQPRLAAIREGNRALLEASRASGEDLFPEAGRAQEPETPERHLPTSRLLYILLYLVPPLLFLLVYWGFRSTLDGLLVRFRS